MAPENVQEDELNESAKAEEFSLGNSAAVEPSAAGRVSEVVAFKFGGTSLLGADRMRHAVMKRCLQTGTYPEVEKVASKPAK